MNERGSATVLHLRRRRNTFKFLAMALGLALMLLLLFKAVTYVAPFILGAILAAIMRPLVRLMGKAKMPRRLACVLALVLVLATVGLVATLLVSQLVEELVSLANNFGQWWPSWVDHVEQFIHNLQSQFTWLDGRFDDWLLNGLDQLGPTMTQALNTTVTGVLGVVNALPVVLVFITVSIMSAYFFVADSGELRRVLERQLPDGWMNFVSTTRVSMIDTLWSYCKAQLLVMCVTFGLLWIGFSILHVPYGVLLAAIIALIDLLPQLGTGIFLNPWAAVCLLSGDYKTGIGLLVLYGVCTVARNVIEPRLVGAQIGLHPLVAMLAMFVGLRVMGVMGMLAGPILLMLYVGLMRVYTQGKTVREAIEEGVDNPLASPKEAAVQAEAEAEADEVREARVRNGHTREGQEASPSTEQPAEEDEKEESPRED